MTRIYFTYEPMVLSQCVFGASLRYFVNFIFPCMGGGALTCSSAKINRIYAILPGCQVCGIKVFRLACTPSIMCRESKSLTSCSGGILRLLAVAQEDGAEGTGPHRLSQDVVVLQHKCRKSTGSLL